MPSIHSVVSFHGGRAHVRCHPLDHVGPMIVSLTAQGWLMREHKVHGEVFEADFERVPESDHRDWYEFAPGEGS